MIGTPALERTIGRTIANIRRTPYPYRTSHKIELLEVVFADGTALDLLLKDNRRSQLKSAVRRARPAFIDDGRREIEAYRLLAEEGLGTATLYDAREHWLLLERVKGVELWQVGDVEKWVDAATWLACLHKRFSKRPPMSRLLLRYDADYLRIWPDRARRAHPSLERVLRAYDRVVTLLSELSPTMIHGEFYASNIMVAADKIVPIDWEMAGVGPGVLDLAALLTGWGEDERAAIIAGYGNVSSDALYAAQLHNAVQWLGWARNWTPPQEHAHDWLMEAFSAAERLGL